MKKIILSAFILTMVTALYAQELVTSVRTNTQASFAPDNAIFTWSETTFDFGKIKQNIPSTHEFTFVNKGNAPLVISSVQASCGCTVAEYSREPVAPGQRGFVKATYNAARAGVFTKTVTINSNTDQSVITLTIKGEVVAE